MTTSSAEARFARALLATSYVIGEPLASLRFEHGDESTRQLRQALASVEREDRARALAAEISRIALALERGALR